MIHMYGIAVDVRGNVYAQGGEPPVYTTMWKLNSDGEYVWRTYPSVGTGWTVFIARIAIEYLYFTAWISGVMYLVGNVVTHLGGEYTCKLNHISSAANEPGVGVDWADYWT